MTFKNIKLATKPQVMFVSSWGGQPQMPLAENYKNRMSISIRGITDANQCVFSDILVDD